MKKILQQKQFLHQSIGSVLSIPSLCRRRTSSLAAVFHMIAFLQGTACFGWSCAFLLQDWFLLPCLLV